MPPDVHSLGFDPSRFRHSGFSQFWDKYALCFSLANLMSIKKFLLYHHFTRNLVGWGFPPATLSLPSVSSSTTSPSQVIFVNSLFAICHLWEVFAICIFIFSISFVKFQFIQIYLDAATRKCNLVLAKQLNKLLLLTHVFARRITCNVLQH